MKWTRIVLLLIAATVLVGFKAPDRDAERIIWEIGQEGANSRFHTDPHGDPTTIRYTLGEPVEQFPSGLGGLGIGKQRSVVEIHFTMAIPEGSLLLIHWSPGEAEGVEQFQVELNGILIGKSPALAGSKPGKWRTDTFNLPQALTKPHVLTFTHLSGDGLTWDYVGMIAKPTIPITLHEPEVNGLSVKINGVTTPGADGPFTWNWGDGTVLESYFPSSHTYQKGGFYHITVTVSRRGQVETKDLYLKL